jgi:hypothetical protein
MFRLFQHKIFYGKYFSYFSVFGATENNSQIENIFDLTKKASIISKNDLRF